MNALGFSAGRRHPGVTHLCGVISHVSVILIRCTDGAKRTFRHDRHSSDRDFWTSSVAGKRTCERQRR